MIRCKLQCKNVVDNGPGIPKVIEFNAQYDPSIPEDQRFTKATPWGQLTISIDNAEEINKGDYFYIDLTKIK